MISEITQWEIGLKYLTYCECLVASKWMKTRMKNAHVGTEPTSGGKTALGNIKILSHVHDKKHKGLSIVLSYFNIQNIQCFLKICWFHIRDHSHSWEFHRYSDSTDCTLDRYIFDIFSVIFMILIFLKKKATNLFQRGGVNFSSSGRGGIFLDYQKGGGGFSSAPPCL